MKSASVAELKARLSHFLTLVRAGETIDVLSHRHRVAQIIPPPDASESIVIAPTRPVSDVHTLDRCGTRDGRDPLATLLDDRTRR